MESSWWQRIPRAVQWPIVVLGFAAGLTATGLAMSVGLVTAHPPCYRVATATIARERVRAGRNAIDRFMLDHGGHCPSSQRPLVAEHYLQPRDLRDPWGTDIAFTCQERGCLTNEIVLSAGPDRVFGTADDIQAD